MPKHVGEDFVRLLCVYSSVCKAGLCVDFNTIRGTNSLNFWAPQSNYLLTYLLTPCSRVLLEKLTVSQLVKKFPAFYGN